MADEKHARRESDAEPEVEDLDVEATGDAAEEVKGGSGGYILGGGTHEAMKKVE